MSQTEKTITDLPENHEEYLMLPTIPLADLKCSYFLGQTPGEEPKIMVKIEEGRLKNIIVSLRNFKVEPKTSSLTFDYLIEYNPYRKVPSKKALEMFIRNCVEKIIHDALSNLTELKEEETSKGNNENRESDTKESDPE